jgi:hypothetical protein
MPEKILYSRVEAAALLGVCPAMLDRLVRSGQIKPRYLGDRPMFTKQELMRFACADAQAISTPSFAPEEA